MERNGSPVRSPAIRQPDNADAANAAAAAVAGNGGGGTWPRQRRRRDAEPLPPVVLADAALVETSGQQVSVSITGRGAAKFFEGSGHTLDELQKLAKANEHLPTFELKGTLRAKAAVKREPVESQNVVGVLPGSDAKLKNEYVVMSAHLDHLGVGRAVNGDAIYNGAMDDASGVARR